LPSKVAKNRTDHTVNVVFKNNFETECVQYATSGQDINLARFDRKLFRIDNGIPILQSEYTHDASKLPPKEDGTVWIVPKIIATIYAGARNDFVYPATHPKDGALHEDGHTKYVCYLRRPATLVGLSS